MKIRLGRDSANKITVSSVEKIRTKKLLPESITLQTNFVSLKSANLNNQYSKTLTLAKQKTAPKKHKIKKPPVQQPQFLKQFEQITKIYQNSREIENEQQFSLLCLDETLDEHNRIRPKQTLFKPGHNRYSQKSSSVLPSIAEKQNQQQRQDDFLITTICKHKERSPLTTATNNRTKNTKSAHDHYVNDFEIKWKSGSPEKKVSIDVQNIIKSRSKTKSSNSHKNQKKKKAG